MPPLFPKFKPLEFTDKVEMEAITSKFDPYSDFNFTSLFSWNTQEEIQIAQLNGNLVVEFTDYICGEHFFSFIGDQDIEKTANQLLNFSQGKEFIQELRLIPQIVADRFLTNPDFEVVEDRGTVVAVQQKESCNANEAV